VIRTNRTAPDLEPIANAIGRARRSVPGRRAVLVAVTGIDGSGKGFVTARLADALRTQGWRTAVVGVDGWLNLPSVRFSDDDPAGHFYRHAIRFGPLFSELVLPLRDRRSLRVEVDHVEEAASRRERRVHEFEEVDVVLLEGIFLLKPAHRRHYDLSVWVECSFATALERAVARAQEGLSPEATVAAYQRIYFPAQRIHLERDDPRAAAMRTIHND
jgi:uridine kinase